MNYIIVDTSVPRGGQRYVCVDTSCPLGYCPNQKHARRYPSAAEAGRLIYTPMQRVVRLVPRKKVEPAAPVRYGVRRQGALGSIWLSHGQSIVNATDRGEHLLFDTRIDAEITARAKWAMAIEVFGVRAPSFVAAPYVEGT